VRGFSWNSPPFRTLEVTLSLSARDGWRAASARRRRKFRTLLGEESGIPRYPLKDSIKGWRLEWFTMENHGKSLPPRSGRQPHVRTPSWVESPTFSEVAEAKVLLAEICSLKDRGPTTEAVVVDFVFKNIQPLKDKVYPSYLYTGINDSTRVTNRQIPNEDLLSRLDMILRGRVSNAGAPLAYYVWNLPPNSPFSGFVSTPSARDGIPGHRVRHSPEDIEASIAPL
jgi:hypothetical protein